MLLDFWGSVLNQNEKCTFIEVVDEADEAWEDEL